MTVENAISALGMVFQGVWQILHCEFIIKGVTFADILLASLLITFGVKLLKQLFSFGESVSGKGKGSDKDA